MADYPASARGGVGVGGGGGGGGGETMMMAVVADDRAPGLLPPRKRLLAGLKHNRNPLSLPPASPLPPPPPPTIATDHQAMADPRFISASHSIIHGFLRHCSSCGLADPRLLLHRLGSPPASLCSSCVLSFHKHMYCFLCLQVFKDFGRERAERSSCLTCPKCQRLSHLRCARKQWPFAFDCTNSATTLCIDCSKPGVGEDLLHARYDHREALEPSSKKQRTGRVCLDDTLALSRGGSKWMSYDLIQQASQELPLVDQEALAAAKVVAAIAEKGARDAKMRAIATAAAAAQAAARAKVALDNAYRAGQEEAIAQSNAEELPQVEASSNPPAGEPMMEEQPAINMEATKQRSSSNVPRNSRSSAPVHKRRTLSAIVASEESRAQANLVGNQGVCMPVAKQQPRRPRSVASKRSVGALDTGRAHASSSQSGVAGIEVPLPASFTPCSSQSGTPQAPSPSSAKLWGVSSPSPPSVLANVPQGSPEAGGSTVVSSGAHQTDSLQCPASGPRVISSMKRRKLLPSAETPIQEMRNETPRFAAGAQDLNLPTERLATISEPNPSTECLRNPPAVLSRASRSYEADPLGRLETSGGASDDGLLENTPRENVMAHALIDVPSIALKSSARPLLQNRNKNNHMASCSNAENGEFDGACLKGSCFQSGQSTDANLGRLEIVLPVIEAVERESPEGCVKTNGTYYGKEAILIEGRGFATCSDDKFLGQRPVIGSSSASLRKKLRDGSSLGARKAKIDNLSGLHLGEATLLRMIEEQDKIRGIAGAAIDEIISKPRSQLPGMHHFLMSSCVDSDNGNDPASRAKRSVVSSCSVPLQAAAVTGSPLELARKA